jgi:hypothetical protein
MYSLVEGFLVSPERKPKASIGRPIHHHRHEATLQRANAPNLCPYFGVIHKHRSLCFCHRCAVDYVRMPRVVGVLLTEQNLLHIIPSEPIQSDSYFQFHSFMSTFYILILDSVFSSMVNSLARSHCRNSSVLQRKFAPLILLFARLFTPLVQRRWQINRN